MPGVSMEPLDDCAESGLESVIGDLLCPLGEAEQDEEEALAGGGREEEVAQRVQEAVCEIRAELQDFGQSLEQRLQERLRPLLETLQELQQDNLRLRLQQERLVRQVDLLCRALQLPEVPPLTLPSPPAPHQLDLLHMLSDGLILDMNNELTSDLEPGVTFDSSEEDSPDKPRVIPDAVAGLTCDPKNGVTALDGMTLDPQLCATSDRVNGGTSEARAVVTPDLADGMTFGTEVDAVPHPPAFSTRRSSSTTSVPTTVSRSNSMVESESAMFAVEPSVHNGSSAKPLTSDQSRGASTAARAQEHTIRVASDQSRAAPAPARAQEHTIRVMTEQSHVSAAQVKAQGSSGRVTVEQLDAIEDEELLDKMLDESKDFEERKLIRAAMRDLRKKKREIRLGCTQEEIDLREKERDLRLEAVKKQREERQKGKAGEMVTKKVEKSADGSTLSQVTKTNRFTHSDDGSRSSRSSTVESSYVQKTDKGTVQSKSYSFSSSSSSSSGKKVGSVFDREDDSAQERRQLEKKKELMRAQTMPKSTANQARKVMMEKLDAGGVGNPAVARVNKVQRSASFGVPNANSIKQMLLDWCRAKTRSYQNVEIKNFSTSWCNGMAFCALVHNFFPQAFDYDSLSPTNRRQNFQLAFDTAEELADVPCLLDVEDMVGMREPDWKCVYTYLQEFYRGLVLKGLVKTKGSA